MDKVTFTSLISELWEGFGLSTVSGGEQTNDRNVTNDEDVGNNSVL